MKNTVLYRHYDAKGCLLYIGISVNAMNRVYSHLIGSEWGSSIARIDLQHFDTKKAALIAEKKAIKKERPKFNILYGEKKRKESGTGRVKTLRLNPELSLMVSEDAALSSRSFNSQIIHILKNHYEKEEENG